MPKSIPNPENQFNPSWQDPFESTEQIKTPEEKSFFRQLLSALQKSGRERALQHQQMQEQMMIVRVILQVALWGVVIISVILYGLWSMIFGKPDEASNEK